jgi:hypothetical protein
VLAKYERGTMLGPEPNAQQFVSTS